MVGRYTLRLLIYWITNITQGGRIAESRVNADRSFSEEEIATASLVGGAPRAGWVGLRYEF
jgi:hypothetical protein